MKTLVFCKEEAMLDGFKFGCDFRSSGSQFTQGVDSRGYWLLIEDNTVADNQTFELSENGLEHTETGVEV